jgi:FAD/FMN-containing dehydrogenase
VRVDTKTVDELKESLAEAVGEKNVLVGSEAEQFPGDALGLARGSTDFAPAEVSEGVVVRPASTEEVGRVVRLANNRLTEPGEAGL